MKQKIQHWVLCACDVPNWILREQPNFNCIGLFNYTHKAETLRSLPGQARRWGDFFSARWGWGKWLERDIPCCQKLTSLSEKHESSLARLMEWLKQLVGNLWCHKQHWCIFQFMKMKFSPTRLLLLLKWTLNQIYIFHHAKYKRTI